MKTAQDVCDWGWNYVGSDAEANMVTAERIAYALRVLELVEAEAAKVPENGMAREYQWLARNILAEAAKEGSSK